MSEHDVLAAWDAWQQHPKELHRVVALHRALHDAHSDGWLDALRELQAEARRALQ